MTAGVRTLAELDDQELARLHHAAMIASNADHLRVIEAEMDRRDAGVPSPDDDPVSRLVARGWSERDAIAFTHKIDPEEMARQERLTLIDADRRRGETRLQVVRRQYLALAYDQWRRAEKACRGHLLSSEALARGVDDRSLFTGSEARALRCASGDLLHWWAEVEPRLPTFEDYRIQVLGPPRPRQAAKTAPKTHRKAPRRAAAAPKRPVGAARFRNYVRGLVRRLTGRTGR